MLIKLHGDSDTSVTIGPKSRPFATIMKSSGVDRASTPLTRVKKMTNLVMDAFKSEYWVETLGGSLTQSEFLIAWQVIDIFFHIEEEIAWPQDYMTELQIQSLLDYTFFNYCNMWFGDDAALLDRWCGEAVGEIMPSLKKDQVISDAHALSRVRVIVSVQLAAKLCLRNEGVALLPGIKHVKS